MSIFKAKAPFFNASYYKELLKELKTIGIIFAVIQLLCGILGEFALSFESVLIGEMSDRIRINSVHTDYFSYFFLACGFHFISTHISRKNWDFRNSLPIAKRTMFTAHFSAVMTFAAIGFAANFAGAFIGEGIRLIKGSMSVPDGFGMSAVSMLKSIVSGISAYCILIIIASIVNNVFSVLAVIGVSFALPLLFIANTAVIRYKDYRGNAASSRLLFPVGIEAGAFIGTALSVMAMLALIVLAYIAFGKSRVETFQRPARTKWIHITIGVLGAGCIGLFSSIIISSIKLNAWNGEITDPFYAYTPWYISVLIFGGIAMFIAYLIYMLLTLKNFGKALKRCVFVPLGFLVVAASALLASIADNKADKLDFSVANIDYIRINDRSLNTNRGSSDAFSVKLTDEKLFRKVADNLSDYTFGSSGILGRAVVFGQTNLFAEDSIEITLKDGSKWAISNSSRYGEENIVISFDDIIGNEEYVKKLASLDSFKNGRVIGFDAELSKTLLEELASLSAADRARLLCEEALYSASNTMLTLVSPTYDHVASIRLSRKKLPKTTELYMKTMSERTRAHKDYDRFISSLEKTEFSDLNLYFGNLETEQTESVYLYADEPFKNGAEYIQDVKEFCALVAECIKENKPADGEAHRFGFDIKSIRLADKRPDGRNKEVLLFSGKPMIVFVGISSKQEKRLHELSAKLNNLQGEFFGSMEAYLQEASYVADAVAAGEISIFDSEGNELSPDKLMEMHCSGCDMFYDKDGQGKHIGEIYEEVLKLHDDEINP